MHGDAVVGDDLVEAVGDRGNAEGPRSGHDEVDVDVLEHALLSPVVGRQVGDLLRAPAHLIAPEGTVNTAVPDRRLRMKSQVRGARSNR